MGMAVVEPRNPHPSPEFPEADVTELAHQLQNRLSVVRASVQLALARCHCAAARPHLQRALAALDGAAAWVSFLMQGHTAEMLHRHEPVRLDRLTLEVVGELADLLERSGVRLQMELDEGERLWVYGSPHLLKGALAHLLVNAVEATPEEGTIRVRTWAQDASEQGPGWACVCVEDSGRGLPPEVLGKAFRSPISTKAPAGRGFGLLLAHRTISRLHGGWISATNLPSGGACICIGLPLAAPPRPLDPSSTATSSHRCGTA